MHKQPDWEVDGKGRAQLELSDDISSNAPLALSAWLRGQLPQEAAPLVHDSAIDFGFLHRLDVPSSGLILCGTTLSGFLCLRWQLDTHRVERQYAVWGHGLAACELQQVVTNIDPQTILSRRSFVSPHHGKPAKTLFIIPAHMSTILHDFLSTFLVRIHTGRRHQIRAHMRYAGHATVADNKYADAVVNVSCRHRDMLFI